MKFVFWFLGLGLVASAAPPDPDEAAYPAIGRFVEVLEVVRKRHPDVDKVAYDRLVNHALEGLLASLDPHSSFIHPEMARQMQEHKDLNPDLPSLGITLGLRDDGPYIAAVSPLGPAAVAGVLPGSALLEIDGRKTPGTEFSGWLELLHRSPGETTRFLLKSPAEPRPLEILLVHRVVAQRSIAESKFWIKESGIGYVRLTAFGNGCAREMEAALDDLEDAGMKGSVQNIIPMGGDTALRLTIATYHTPSGNTPHRKGITPDAPVAIHDTDRANFIKRCQIDSLGPEDRKSIEAWEDPVIVAAAKRLGK